jgi:hypothetical protein
MSSSQHPIALRLEQQVGGDGRLLATVMGLPLIDGIFPALVLAGALSSPEGILQVGLLVFGGSATLAVILAEMEGSPREQARTVLLVGSVLIGVAALEAAVAPTIQTVLDLDVFKRFAALVIAAVAAKTASSTVGEYLPRPAVIVGLGLVASADPAGARFAVTMNPELVARAVAAAAVGVGFALGAAIAGPRLRESVDVDRFRFGSAVALGLLPLSILGMAFGGAPLAVIGVTGLLAYDPDGVDADLSEIVEREDDEREDTAGDDAGPEAETEAPAPHPAAYVGAGGSVTGPDDADPEEAPAAAPGATAEGDDRPPWQ